MQVLSPVKFLPSTAAAVWAVDKLQILAGGAEWFAPLEIQRATDCKNNGAFPRPLCLEGEFAMWNFGAKWIALTGTQFVVRNTVLKDYNGAT